MSVISPEEQHSQSLSTQWTGAASLGLGEKTVSACDEASHRMSECMFYCESFILFTLPFQVFIQFLLQMEISQIFLSTAGFDKSIEPSFKTSFSQSCYWLVNPFLRSGGVQGSCLPAGLEHPSSHSSVPDFGAQFAYVATSLWEYLPLNT